MNIFKVVGPLLVIGLLVCLVYDIDQERNYYDNPNICFLDGGVWVTYENREKEFFCLDTLNVYLTCYSHNPSRLTEYGSYIKIEQTILGSEIIKINKRVKE